MIHLELISDICKVLAKWFEDFLELSKQIQILKGTEEDQAKKSMDETKKKLDKLSEEIVEWAKSEKSN